MVEASNGIEWVLLVVVIGAVVVGAFALTARQVGGWRQMQAQLTSPTLPMRYILLIIPATAGTTVFIDPLDTLSGASWISGLLTFLALFAGSLWTMRPSVSTGRAGDAADDGNAHHRERQRRLAASAVAGALIFVVLSVVLSRRATRLVDGPPLLPRPASSRSWPRDTGSAVPVDPSSLWMNLPRKTRPQANG